MTVVRRAPDLDRRVSSLPSPQESSSFAGLEYLSNGDRHMYNSDRPLGTSSAMVRWPVLDTGRNSVTPSTMPNGQGFK
jgi:hypothetical protein